MLPFASKISILNVLLSGRDKKLTPKIQVTISNLSVPLKIEKQRERTQKRKKRFQEFPLKPQKERSFKKSEMVPKAQACITLQKRVEKL